MSALMLSYVRMVVPAKILVAAISVNAHLDGPVRVVLVLSRNAQARNILVLMMEFALILMVATPVNVLIPGLVTAVSTT